MLTIKTEEDYASALEELGAEAKDGSTVMTMRDSEQLMGAGVMRLRKDHVEIDGIYIKEEFKDFSLEFGMGKSLLNVADLRGIHHAVCNNPDMENVLKALRFKKVQDLENVPENLKDNVYYLNLTRYFEANC